MYELFGEQVKLFQQLIKDAKKTKVDRHCAVIEVGMGTSELFSKILDDVDMLCGVEISQKFIDTS
jgi:16S rRNA A1518/A1519 N6-dimethyltransferase RsmA/KsgA/DIM1 with predicted DNA glycosylase/AP lyase activity